MIHSFLSNTGPFFILLGLLIFVHELGHFLVAKYFGVRVETFSMGFGKKILSWKRGDTTYCISLLPLGGYVKMYGDDSTAEVPAEERARAFLYKPVLQRVAIVLAGPLMNLFFAIFIFTMIAGVGEELPGPFAGDVAADSNAYSSGFRSGDKIASINGETTPTWAHVRNKIEAAGGKSVEFLVERKGEAQPLKFDAAVSFGENENIFSANRQVGGIPGLTPESRSLLIGVADPQSPAAKAGLRSLDLIVAVNGRKISFWRDLEPALQEALTAPDAAGDRAVTIDVRSVEDENKPEATRSHKLVLPLTTGSSTLEAAGLEPAELYIFRVSKESPALKAGIEAKDKVVRIDGEEVHTWNDVLSRVKAFDPESTALDFTVVRGGAEKTFKIRPEMTKMMTLKGQEERRFTIGIQSGYIQVGPEPVFYRITNPMRMLKTGIEETKNWSEFVVMSMVRLIQGDVSAKNIGGVITIGRVAAHSFAAGFSTFLRTMAIISINLFLLNLLPVPILDGGHLVFYAIEALRGAPLSMRKMELAQQIGLMILMCLMVFAFFNDITNFFYNRW